MSDEQRALIEDYAKKLNSTIAEDDGDLLDFVVSEVADRVMLYLNDDHIDEQLNRVIARIVSGIFNQTKASQSSSSPDLVISSVSDNGQSVSYANEVANYLSTTTDNELFTGFETLLNRYRRINVVSPERE